MKLKNIIIFLVISLVSIVSCKPEEEKDTAAEQVHLKVIRAEMQGYKQAVRTSGKVASEKELKLSFKTGGVISQINAGEGEEVEKGQMLASLQMDEVGAVVEQAELATEKAKRDLQRVQHLYSDSVATLEQLQNARTALNAAEAQLKAASFNYRHSIIKAPSQGKILKKLAEEDEIIAAGHPVFLFASTKSGWVVKASLTDKEVVRVSLNDSVQILLDAYPDKKLTGRVSELGQFADPYTGTFDVEVEILEPHPALASGFVARVFIWPANQQSNVLLPVESITDAEKFTGFVYRIKNGEAIRTRVRLGEIINDKVIVREGVNPGDSIVKEGVNYIDENKEIVIEE